MLRRTNVGDENFKDCANCTNGEAVKRKKCRGNRSYSETRSCTRVLGAYLYAEENTFSPSRWTVKGGNVILKNEK
jgi:hypothetical protein